LISCVAVLFEWNVASGVQRHEQKINNNNNDVDVLLDQLEHYCALELEASVKKI
jgi:hypothetical protein